MKIEEKISEIISMCMYHKSNLEMVEVFRNFTLINEFLINFKNRQYYSRNFVGSFTEGTSNSKSDVDVLSLWSKITICQKEDRVENNNGLVFCMERTECDPGYVKLKLLKNEVDANFEMPWEDKEYSIMEIVEKTDSGYYLSNHKFWEITTLYLRNADQSRTCKNGPCVCVELGQTQRSGSLIGSKSLDFAQGLELYSMAKEGKDWLKRMDSSKYIRNWPSVHTIEKIRTLKCAVVAIGIPGDKSSDSLLTWRISYTLWERELMWSLQDVHRSCFLILKFFCQTFFRKITDEVTSYHLKNIVFLEAAATFVPKFPLLYFLRKCLVRLRSAIIDRKLEHFIDRDMNLFKSKLKDREKNQELVRCLNKAMNNSSSIVSWTLECIGEIWLKSIWEMCGCDPVLFLFNFEIHFKKLKETEFSKIVKPHLKMISYGEQLMLLRLFLMHIPETSLDLIVRNFAAMERLDVDPEYIEEAKKCILFRQKIITAEKLNYCDARFLQELHTEAFNDQLLVCTHLIRQDRFRDAIHILDNFLKSGPKAFLHRGLCICPYIIVENGEARHHIVSPYEIAEVPFSVLNDFMFFGKNIDFFLPDIENLGEVFFIDILVCVYFFYVICEINMKKNADRSLAMLEKTVRDVEHPLQREDLYRHNIILEKASNYAKERKQS